MDGFFGAVVVVPRHVLHVGEHHLKVAAGQKKKKDEETVSGDETLCDDLRLAHDLCLLGVSFVRLPK